MTAPRLQHAYWSRGSPLSTAGAALAQDDPLPPQEVFRYTARADAERVYVDFDVLDGYYLYRGRFGFDSGTERRRARRSRASPAARRTPTNSSASRRSTAAGSRSRSRIGARAPVTSFDLKLELQGCAPTFCYLPQDWTATVTLPPPAFLGAGAIDTSATGDLLPVDDAFTMNARFDKPNELTVAWQIAPGYYLYRDKLTFAATAASTSAPRTCRPASRTPTTTSATSRCSTTTSRSRCRSRARARTRSTSRSRPASKAARKTAFAIRPASKSWRSCCRRRASFRQPAAPAGGGELVSEQDQWLSRIVNGSWWTLLGGFYVAGLLLSFTPCVLPMVPILSSIIAGQGGTVSTQRGFLAVTELRARHGGHVYRAPAPSRRSRAARFKRCSRSRGSSRCSPACSSCWRSACSACSSCRCRPRSKRGSRTWRTARRAARSSARPSSAR